MKALVYTEPRRLEMLETNMRAYYLWFALKGKALQMPQEQLVAIMVPDSTTFKIQRTALDAPPCVSDGFFSARDNVAVFATQRLDEAYQIFSKMMQSSVWQKGWNRKDLLTGNKVPSEMKKGDTKWRQEYARCQTLASVRRGH